MSAEPEHASRTGADAVRIANLIFFLIGAVALAWMVSELGLAQLALAIRSVRAWVVPLFATTFAAMLLNAKAIHIFMRPEQRMVSYWRVFAAQFCGQAVNSVTPTGTLGEVVKATMLMGHTPRYRAISSIVTYNLTYVFAQGALLVVAMAVSLTGDLPDEIEWILRVAIAGLIASSAVGLWAVRRGLVRTFVDIGRRVRVISTERRERIAARLASFDEQLQIFGAKKQARHGAGILCVLAAALLGWFDLWLLLRAVGHPQSIAFVAVAGTAGVIIAKLASIIPLGIGVADGGQAGLFALLGPGALVGLVVSLVGRLRTVAIAITGLSLMLALELADHLKSRRLRQRLKRRVAAKAPGTLGSLDEPDR